MKIIIGALLVIMLAVLALLAYRNTTNKTINLPFTNKEKSGEKAGKDNMKKNKEEDNNEIRILQRWYLPDVLTEISDISYVNDHSIACIQDEIGTLFLFDLTQGKIVKEISFAGQGDYEGIATVGEIAYVVNSSGVLYEINYLGKGKPEVQKYATGFTAKDDVEALCYDKENNRLLIASKADEAGDSKGIYSFDLNSKQLNRQPVYKIEDKDLSGDEKKGKKKRGVFRPSAMAIHPSTGELYITQGTNPRLLVLDKQGSMKANIKLGGKGFAQPEGITFSPTGDMYISNEGGKEAGNILKVGF